MQVKSIKVCHGPIKTERACTVSIVCASALHACTDILFNAAARRGLLVYVWVVTIIVFHSPATPSFCDSSSRHRDERGYCVGRWRPGISSLIATTSLNEGGQAYATAATRGSNSQRLMITRLRFSVLFGVAQDKDRLQTGD